MRASRPLLLIAVIADEVLRPLLIRNRRFAGLPSLPCLEIRRARVVDNHETRAPKAEFQAGNVLFKGIGRERLPDDTAPCHEKFSDNWNKKTALKAVGLALRGWVVWGRLRAL